MKIMALLTPSAGKTMADVGPHLVEEEKAVWADYKAGFLREFYFQPDPPAATLIFEAASASDVEAKLRTYPMIAAGLLDMQFVTLGPWAQLEALFDKAHLS